MSVLIVRAPRPGAGSDPARNTSRHYSSSSTTLLPLTVLPSCHFCFTHLPTYSYTSEHADHFVTMHIHRRFRSHCLYAWLCYFDVKFVSVVLFCLNVLSVRITFFLCVSCMTKTTKKQRWLNITVSEERQGEGSRLPTHAYAPRFQSRSATATPTTSPKKRQLPQIPHQVKFLSLKNKK